MKKIIVYLILVSTIMAQDIAIVKELKGDVLAKSDKLYTLYNGMRLAQDMIIITKDKSSVKIIFNDNSVVSLGSNSILNLKKFVFSPDEKSYDFKLFLEKGKLVFESGKISELSPEDFELQTPEGIVAIRGTKFIVNVD